MFDNWKTSSTGFAALIAAVLDIISQITTKTFDANRFLADVTAIFVGLGLVAAKDA